jgi:hypothetical protein
LKPPGEGDNRGKRRAAVGASCGQNIRFGQLPAPRHACLSSGRTTQARRRKRSGTVFAIGSRTKGRVSSAVRRMALRTKLDRALRAVGETPVEAGAYSKARQPRNQLAHPTQVKLKAASQRCSFCSFSRLGSLACSSFTARPALASSRSQGERLTSSCRSGGRGADGA